MILLYQKRKIGDHFIYLFENVKLRAEEETTFIELICKGKKRQE
jgi:hypothetical protein